MRDYVTLFLFIKEPAQFFTKNFFSFGEKKLSVDKSEK